MSRFLLKIPKLLLLVAHVLDLLFDFLELPCNLGGINFGLIHLVNKLSTAGRASILVCLQFGVDAIILVDEVQLDLQLLRLLDARLCGLSQLIKCLSVSGCIEYLIEKSSSDLLGR